MAEVVCVDGSVLSVLPVPRLDRRGAAYEVTLRLLLDGAPFGAVGECSGWRLARAASQVRAAQARDGTSALPVTGVDALLDGAGRELSAFGGASELRRLLPRDRELLSLRSRDPDDGGGAGELRIWLRDDRTWVPGADGSPGRWATRSRAVVDSWGNAGRGVRCLLDAPALLALLDGLVTEAAAVAGRSAGV